MGRWSAMVITASVPKAKVYLRCEKSVGGCKESKTCVEYAVERLVRSIALDENERTHETEYNLRRVAMRSGRLRNRQI